MGVHTRLRGRRFRADTTQARAFPRPIPPIPPPRRYQALYGGDPLYAGHAEMLQVIRRNAPTALVLLSSTGYAQDAAFLLALRLQYTAQTGAPPTNVLYVLHPYQGMYQGVWISLRSTLRLTLALQAIGPVIFTELGQCVGSGAAPARLKRRASPHATGACEASPRPLCARVPTSTSLQAHAMPIARPPTHLPIPQLPLSPQVLLQRGQHERVRRARALQRRGARRQLRAQPPESRGAA